MAERATAWWVVAEGAGELRGEMLPEPAGGQVLVRSRASAISRGTESLVFHGNVPESERTRMRCPFQAGEFPWPVKYGYAAVGVVERGPAALMGRRVFALHPHQDRFVVPADAVVPVPDAVPERRATLGANTETALNGLWDAGLAEDRPAPPGTNVAVIGAGALGLLIALLARGRAGAEVEIIEPDTARAVLARDLGFRVAAGAGEASEAAIVFEVSGQPDGLAAALDLAAFEGTIMALSWFGSRPVTLPLGGAFHARRLTIRSSQVGAVSPSRRGRVSHRERLTRALALLDDPLFDRLLGETVPFRNMPEAMPRILSRPVTPPVTPILYPG
ncbi:MAG: dehydrogenase [Alphaproteobacteria bacterium]|nr:dehydrogenase [Alphaproteobacteria bacterium]